jgi:hypothetical protein
MRDLVIVLLVNAAVTIITTVVTVRLTATGRILSQTAKQTLISRAKYVAACLWALGFASHSTINLYRSVASTDPLDRMAVMNIAFFTCNTYFWALWFIVILTFFAAHVLMHLRQPQQ